MSTLDASRFISNLHALFAPHIDDDQDFIAYIDGEPNSLVIQGENILYPHSADALYAQLSASLKYSSEHISTLMDKADYVENLCNSIPGFITKIDSISGQFEGIPEFLFDIIHFDIADLKANFAALDDRIKKLEALFYSDKNNSDNSNNADFLEAISSMETKLEALQFTVDTLASEIHSSIVSEAKFNVSD